MAGSFAKHRVGRLEKNPYIINLKSILDFLAMFVFAVLIFSGITYVGEFKRELLVVGAALCFFSFMVANLQFKLFNVIPLVWICVIGYMFASTMLHNHTTATIKYVFVYAACFVAMLSGFTKKEYLLFIKICEIFGLVFVASIFIEVVFPRLFTTQLAFIFHTSSKVSKIQSEINSGMFSGLSGEKGEASFVTNIFIAIQLFKIFAKRKADKITIVFLIIGIIALMFTGKRTMLVIPIIGLLAFMFVNKIKGKYIKIVFAGIFLVIAIYITTLIFPQAAVTIDRIFNSKSDDMLTGRGALWNVCKSMFMSSPWFGKGFAGFNTFANHDYEVGVLMIKQNISEWTVQAHSIYYQFFGELGLLGAVPAFGIMVYTLFKTLTLRKYMFAMDTDNRIVYHFSLYFQIWFMVYGATGNVGYNPQNLIIYFLAVGAYLYLANLFKSDKVSDLSQAIGSLRKDFDYENRYSNISEGA